MVMARRRPQLEDPCCHWCSETIGESPYRTPIVDIPGGRWMVCGPLCPERPEGVLVFTDWRAK